VILDVLCSDTSEALALRTHRIIQLRIPPHRVPTPPGKSWIFFPKIPGPGNSWKMSLVLESPGN